MRPRPIIGPLAAACARLGKVVAGLETAALAAAETTPNLVVNGSWRRSVRRCKGPALVAMILATCAIATPPAQAATALVNGGFESGLTGWTASGAEIQVVHGQSDPAFPRYEAREGYWAANLFVQLAPLTLTQEFDASAGARVSGAALLSRRSGSSGTAEGQVRIVDGTGKMISQPFLSTQPVGWTQWSVTLPSDGTYRIEVQVAGDPFNWSMAVDGFSVAPPNSAPTVAVQGVVSGATYEIGTVPSAVCAVTDSEDGVSSTPAVLSGALTHGLGTRTATCDHTDTGGLAAATSSATYTIVDTRAPSVPVFLGGPAAGSTTTLGKTPTAPTCTSTDTGSGLAGCVVTGYSSAVGTHTLTATATDHVGNTSTATRTYTVIQDGTAPVITRSVSPAAPDGQNAWYRSVVAVSWTVTDPESSHTSSGCVDTTISTDTPGQDVTCSASSTGGSASDSLTLKRDATPPAIELVGGPAGGGTWVFGSVPTAPTCTASDATSGLAGTCLVTGYSTQVGTHTVTATAVDRAGNSAAAQRSYTVSPWTLRGFTAPVDTDGVVNTVKGGSTVPLKFTVLAGTTPVTATTAVTFTTARTICSTGAPVDEVETTTTDNTGLRYDTASGQFIQSWKTPKQPGSCYRTTMTGLDGSTISALFQLK